MFFDCCGIYRSARSDRFRNAVALGRELRQAEIEVFRVSTLSDKNVRWLNVAMHNALAVGCILYVCDLYRDVQQQVRSEGLACDLQVKSRAFQQFHGNDRLGCELVNLIKSTESE